MVEEDIQQDSSNSLTDYIDESQRQPMFTREYNYQGASLGEGSNVQMHLPSSKAVCGSKSLVLHATVTVSFKPDVACAVFCGDDSQFFESENMRIGRQFIITKPKPLIGYLVSHANQKDRYMVGYQSCGRNIGLSQLTTKAGEHQESKLYNQHDVVNCVGSNARFLGMTGTAQSVFVFNTATPLHCYYPQLTNFKDDAMYLNGKQFDFNLRTVNFSDVIQTKGNTALSISNASLTYSNIRITWAQADLTEMSINKLDSLLHTEMVQDVYTFSQVSNGTQDQFTIDYNPKYTYDKIVMCWTKQTTLSNIPHGESPSMITGKTIWSDSNAIGSFKGKIAPIPPLRRLTYTYDSKEYTLSNSFGELQNDLVCVGEGHDNRYAKFSHGYLEIDLTRLPKNATMKLLEQPDGSKARTNGSHQLICEYSPDQPNYYPFGLTEANRLGPTSAEIAAYDFNVYLFRKIPLKLDRGVYQAAN